MDEYQHYERFDLENDFEDGEFVDGEFIHKGKKQKRKQTKEDTLYGVFNESDSDEDGGKRRKRGEGGLIGKKADYQKPVNFTSAGTFDPSKEAEKLKENAGLGFTPASGHAGLGFTSGDAVAEENEVSEEEGDEYFKMIKAAAEKRKEREKQKEKEKPNKTGERKGKGAGDTGSFEKHTKGIGMKLLEKMGFKAGGGLGKNHQGILAPVEAKLRRKQVGLGFGQDSEDVPEPIVKPEAVVEPVDKPKQNLWKKNAYPKIKRVHKTAAEVLAESENKNVGMTTILDMRGPQVRVLTNLERINDEATMKEHDTPMPELQHNLRLIVDLAEAEIQTCDRKLRQERDSIVILHKERDRLHEDVKLQEQQMRVLERIVATVESCQQLQEAKNASLDTFADVFESIQGRYQEEYKLYGMGSVALSYVMPLMTQHFYNWDPLTMPSHGPVAMKRWQGLLMQDDGSQSIFTQDLESDMDPYTVLVKEAVLPSLRLSTLNSWEPRDPEPLLRFLETWEGLLPPSVQTNILEQLVMPKLTMAVDAWDPRLETVPIHKWLHPWLPLLGSRMEPLYPPIRFKMGAALQAWHASDVSAYILLSPWQRVFDAASWEAMTVRCILPKLMFAMQELTINPHHQVLDQFDWVVRWVGAVPTHHMVGLLETAFFPKWQQMLYQWLCARPNFSEVERWYRGWSSKLPPELHANERVRMQLNAALDMMNQALEGAPVVEPGARENLSYLRVTEQRQFESQQQQQAQQQPQQPPPPGMSMGPPGMDPPGALLSLKEVVETFAGQSEVAFVPKVGRMHEGLQVYSFGNVSIAIDTAKQSIAAQAGDRWTPVSLEQLLEMHRARMPGTRWK